MACRQIGHRARTLNQSFIHSSWKLCQSLHGNVIIELDSSQGIVQMVHSCSPIWVLGSQFFTFKSSTRSLRSILLYYIALFTIRTTYNIIQGDAKSMETQSKQGIVIISKPIIKLYSIIFVASPDSQSIQYQTFPGIYHSENEQIQIFLKLQVKGSYALFSTPVLYSRRRSFSLYNRYIKAQKSSIHETLSQNCILCEQVSSSLISTTYVAMNLLATMKILNSRNASLTGYLNRSILGSTFLNYSYHVALQLYRGNSIIYFYTTLLIINLVYCSQCVIIICS